MTWNSDMDAAPRDGRLLLSLWDGTPVFIAWSRMSPKARTEWSGLWPLKTKTTITVEESGWRVLALGRSGDYGFHGNYAPYQPVVWQTIPDPPESKP